MPIVLSASIGNNGPVLSIVTDASYESPVAYGIEKLTSSLDKNKTPYEKISSIASAQGRLLLVAGLSTGDGAATRLIKEQNHPLPKVAEALSIWETAISGKPTWVASGFDSRGLMYALLDIADHVAGASDSDNPLFDLTPVTEAPYVTTRAISMYTMNRTYWESRFYDEAYWKRYMDVLAKNRFNSLVLIFGYENGGFLAPCYPYFFNVEGFPDIGMACMSTEEQQRNLSALNRMIQLAHERGLEFKVAIWDHIYRQGIQTGGISKDDHLPGLTRNHQVQGVTGDNLFEYTKAAFAKFIRLVPDLDGVQFRMHNESGLKPGEEMEMFWTEIFGKIKSTTPDLRIDLRAKELPDKIIQIVIDMGLNFTITTKYWMEQMGLPFHPTHINRQNQFDRRHGYADMLRYPRQFDIHWRMWTAGTQRILLWGSPDYVRRFAESTHLYDGQGFEINEPLATKMDGQPHDAKPFALLNSKYVYYDYEFERYWHFFQVFGRVAYNPNTSPELWSREFNQRFGDQAGPLIQEALHTASYILPTINAACAPYSVFPTTRGWVAKQRLGELEDYALAQGSDLQQFASFDEEALVLLAGYETARRLPSQTAQWFIERSDEIEAHVADAKSKIKDKNNNEFISTMTDLMILANVARYHAYRMPAAVCYRIYVHSRDPFALDDAIAWETKAIRAWKKIVDAAGDVYAPDLMMGSRKTVKDNIIHRLSGHWRDELPFMEKGLEALHALRKSLPESRNRITPIYKPAKAASNSDLFQVEHKAVTRLPLGQELKISATIRAKAGIHWVRLRYRPVNQHNEYHMLPMFAENGSDLYQVMVPEKSIDRTYDFMYFIEMMDHDDNAMIYPDLDVETPYMIVKLTR